MAKRDTPAGDTGGRPNAPTATSPSESAESSAGDPGAGSPGDVVAQLPDRLRVHALAKLLATSSKQVIATLTELGVAVRSAQSSIDRPTAVRVVEVLRPDAASGADLVSTGVGAGEPAGASAPPLTPLFNAPEPVFLPPSPPQTATEDGEADSDEADSDTDSEGDESGSRRRRRRGRRGRGRGKGGDGTENGSADQPGSTQPGNGQSGNGQDGAEPEEAARQAKEQPGEADSDDDAADAADAAGADSTDNADNTDNGEGSRRRRRRRRRRETGDEESLREDDPPDTVVHVREVKDRPAEDEVQAVRGSTRLEAKRQRRRDGREAGRRRAPILSESEFLTRRESVARTMVVREDQERIQIAVLEDDILVEHFVTASGSGSLVGNVYLGKVQNVLPSMEAAFVDIGRGRNAVLYAGEVDWDAAGLEGKARRIEQALSSGDSVLVQVTKDPVGHKGARLTTQISLPGRFLVYVPGGRATGISRKLPDSERRRLKEVLKRIVPEDAGVIIRTASEGISEEELARDVRRLQAQWEVIQNRAGTSATGVSTGSKVKAPELLYEEPDLLVKVVRDLFTEDFRELVVQGDTAWETVEGYVQHVAPDLMPRVRRHTSGGDVFADFRIDEQITKALDRKVWLPSGGYLVIDRTEAMTVIDVNTGKFTGSGGNLEETVTRNNLEAAEEIIRQLRLRDIGGIIVIDFIDMVLESNRDLVLRRLTECLGRDRTRHQVAEVTSLGLVQMTRKKIGTGLLETHSTACEHCKGRGVLVSSEPVNVRAAASSGASAPAAKESGGGGGGSRRSRSRGRGSGGGGQEQSNAASSPAAASQQSTAEQSTAQQPASEPSTGAEPVTSPASSSAAAPEVAATKTAPAKAAPAKAASTKTAPAKTARAKAASSEASAAPEPSTPDASTPAPSGGEPSGGAPSGGDGDEGASAGEQAPGAGSSRSGAAKTKPTPVPARRRSRGSTAQETPPAASPADGEAAPDGSGHEVEPSGETPGVPTQSAPRTSRRRRAASRPAGPPATDQPDGPDAGSQVSPAVSQVG